ncbi:MAG: winged helix-turn-helix domain-containing protein [Steroidobacteraceae bacterium]
MDRIRVGNLELFPSERMLRAAGKPVELGARAFDMLLVLVEHHGRLVTKATLLERVWPRLVVDENNLPAQIASLRRVLGAGAIHTVPGFGYRLELEVSVPGSGADAPASPAVQDGHEPPRLSVSRRGWPERLGPLVGRDDDMRALQEALDRSWLVTIVGTAGVGKTRLAREILARRSEGTSPAVAWVSLEPLDDAQHVPSAIALALGLSLPDGVDGFVALHKALEKVPLLLILDGAEHLGDALVAPLATLILQTEGVRALVTSQAPLGIAGEIVYRLSVLPVPEAGTPDSQAAGYPAVAMFAHRAAAADRRFELNAGNTPLVAEICRRLDGIPLALELAAARVPSLGLSALLERLDDRFRLLKAGGQTHDPRHGALHAAFDWSYGLLTAPEQQVFDRLGTFAGSFSLKAAARCVADETIDTTEAIDLIGRLVDRSLVTAMSVDPPRYTLLETARYYALSKLTAKGELEAARARMAAAMLDLLDHAYQEYWSLDEAIWLHRYEPELDNVRAAIDWTTGNDYDLGVALYGSTWPLFVETDLYAEGRARYAQVLETLRDTMARERVGRFWEAIATYDSTRQSDRARYAAELAAQMHTATNAARSHYYALMLLAFNSQADATAARAAFDSARRLEDPTWPSRLLAYGAMTEGALLMGAEQFVEARAAYLRAVKLALTTSERQALAATVNIVELDIACGNTGAALQLGRPLALSLRHLGRRETRFELLVMIFSALLIAGETDEARATGAELLELAMRIDTSKLFSVLDAMAYLCCEQRRFDAAARIAVCSDWAHEAHGEGRRRPAAERMRTSVETVLERNLGPVWRAAAGNSAEPLDEVAACSLALGLNS